jgi:hypothetical protein
MYVTEVTLQLARRVAALSLLNPLRDAQTR